MNRTNKPRFPKPLLGTEQQNKPPLPFGLKQQMFDQQSFCPTYELDRNAAAKALDPIAFWPRSKHGNGEAPVSDQYWSHIRTRRRNARNYAAQVMLVLEKRGWRTPRGK